MHENELTSLIIGSAIEVHKNLGPGLLESVYETCLAKELKLQGVPFQQQVGLPVEYKGEKCEVGYRIDILVDKKVIVEIKSVEAIHPVYEAQLLTYLRLSECKVGLLINFNVPVLKDGIKRMVYKF